MLMGEGKYFKFNDMKMTFKTADDLAEWVYTMHLQNTSGRETENEMFRLGIENCIQELTELNLLDLPVVTKTERSAVLGCPECGCRKSGYNFKTENKFCCYCGHEWATCL